MTGSSRMRQSCHCAALAHVDSGVVTFLDFLRLTRANFLVILGCVTLGVLAMFALHAAPAGRLHRHLPGVRRGRHRRHVRRAADQHDPPAARRPGPTSTLVSDRRVGERVADELGLDLPPEAIAGQPVGHVGRGQQPDHVSGQRRHPEEARDLANAAVDRARRGHPRGGERGLPRPAVHLIGWSPGEQALLPGAPSSPDYQRNLLFGALAGLRARLRRRAAAPVGRPQGPHGRQRRGGRDRRRSSASSRWLTRCRRRQPGGPRGPRRRRRGLPAAAHQPALRRRGPPAAQHRGHQCQPARGQVHGLVQPGPDDGRGRAADAARSTPTCGDPAWPRPSTSTPPSGLTQVLVGDLTVDDVLQETRTPNLQVITAGRIPPNPSELLGSQRMHAARRRADRGVHGHPRRAAPAAGHRRRAC